MPNLFELALYMLLPPLAWGLFWGLLCYGLCLPRLGAKPRAIHLAALACAGYACALVLLWWWRVVLMSNAHPPAWVLSLATYPTSWLGKGLSLLWSVLVVAGLRWLTPNEAGLRAPQPGSLSKVAPVVAVVAVVLLTYKLFTPQHLPRWLPQQLYVATLPGLAEELFYRGVLLGLLSRAFPRTIALPGIHTTWGGVVSVLLFAVGHILKFPAFLPSALYQLGHGTLEHGFQLWPYVSAWLFPADFSLADFGYFALLGTLFLWVRERTGSCWVAAGTHCLVNSCLAVGHSLS